MFITKTTQFHRLKTIIIRNKLQLSYLALTKQYQKINEKKKRNSLQSSVDLFEHLLELQVGLRLHAGHVPAPERVLLPANGLALDVLRSVLECSLRMSVAEAHLIEQEVLTCLCVHMRIIVAYVEHLSLEHQVCLRFAVAVEEIRIIEVEIAGTRLSARRAALDVV